MAVSKPLIEKEADVLFDYYIGRPQLTRNAVILIFECVAFAFSIHSYITGNESGAIIAYFIIIATVVIGESTMHYWRKTRNNSLHEIKGERKQYLLTERDVTSETKEALSETEKTPAETKGQ